MAVLEKSYLWLCPCTRPHGVTQRAVGLIENGHYLPSRCRTSRCDVSLVVLREIPTHEPKPPHATNRLKSGFRQINWSRPA